MKNKNFFQSVKCALRGLKNGFSSEKNFKIYIGITSFFILLNVLLSSRVYDYIILIILVSAAFITEYINTAIERICDRFCSEQDEDIRFIKDVAAGAVLVAGFAFFTVEGIILLPKILWLLGMLWF